MGKIIDGPPARFSKNDRRDRKTISELNHLLDADRVIPQLGVGDKFPNRDGFLTILDAKGSPIGDIEVQVKTLNKRQVAKPKYQFKQPFLSYCNKTLLPFVVILVDVENSCAYWKQITKDFVKELDKKIGTKKSISVEFSIKDKITVKANGYIEAWERIVSKAQNYSHEKEIEINNLNASLAQLENIAGKHEINPNVIQALHEFVDYLNMEWDVNFLEIKKARFPSVWKFGVGYGTFKPKEATITIYPVTYTENHPLIKKVKGFESVSFFPFFKTSNFITENPILQRPLKYTLELVKEDLFNQLENRRLIPASRTLVLEYLWSFINTYSYILEIERRESYTVEQIRVAISDTLVKNVRKIASQRPSLVVQNRVDLEQILKIPVKELNQLLSVDSNWHGHILITSGKYNVGYVVNHINFLIAADQKTINYFLPLRVLFDTQRQAVFKQLDSNEKFERLRLLFNALPDAYDDFLSYYFPNLINELRLFKGFNLIVIVYYPGTVDRIGIFGVEKLTESNPTVRVIKQEEDLRFDSVVNPDLLSENFEFEGEKCVLRQGSVQPFNIQNFGLPLLEVVHLFIRERLKEYFDARLSSLG